MGGGTYGLIHVLGKRRCGGGGRSGGGGWYVICSSTWRAVQVVLLVVLVVVVARGCHGGVSARRRLVVEVVVMVGAVAVQLNVDSRRCAGHPDGVLHFALAVLKSPGCSIRTVLVSCL